MNNNDKILKNYFFYGTLVSEGVFHAVTGNRPRQSVGVLHGFRKEGLNIIDDVSESVTGVVVPCNRYEIMSLDEYEGVERGLYQKIIVEVEVDGEGVECVVYQLVDDTDTIIIK